MSHASVPTSLCWLQQGSPLLPRARDGYQPQLCSLSFPRGSAYANTISQFMQTIFLFLYIVLKKLYLETWTGGEGLPIFGGAEQVSR